MRPGSGHWAGLQAGLWESYSAESERGGGLGTNRESPDPVLRAGARGQVGPGGRRRGLWVGSRDRHWRLAHGGWGGLTTYTPDRGWNMKHYTREPARCEGGESAMPRRGIYGACLAASWAAYFLLGSAAGAGRLGTSLLTAHVAAAPDIMRSRGRGHHTHRLPVRQGEPE
jgi:hypothetical protein